MEENRVVEINKEKTEALKEAYKNTLDILDAYDHHTLVCPGGHIMMGMKVLKK